MAWWASGYTLGEGEVDLSYNNVFALITYLVVAI